MALRTIRPANQIQDNNMWEHDANCPLWIPKLILLNPNPSLINLDNTALNVSAPAKSAEGFVEVGTNSDFFGGVTLNADTEGVTAWQMIPYDLNRQQPVYIRGLYSPGVVSAGDHVDLTINYDRFPMVENVGSTTNTILSTPSTALDTAISAEEVDLEGRTIGALYLTPEGMIAAGTFSELDMLGLYMDIEGTPGSGGWINAIGFLLWYRKNYT